MKALKGAVFVLTMSSLVQVALAADQKPLITYLDHRPADWTTDDVYRFLQSLNLGEYRDLFESEEVDGKALLQLNGDSAILREVPSVACVMSRRLVLRPDVCCSCVVCPWSFS